MNDFIFKLTDVFYRYSDGTNALENCSLVVRRGTRTAVLGDNGAGKTTMFLHLNGILRPNSGQVSCDGMPLDYSRGSMRKLRSRIGMVFQNPDSQLFSANVREDISFGPMNLGLDEMLVQKRVDEALLSVDMMDCADKPVHNLSYGQKKRVCIAGVLAMQPEIIVLDEPMAGLDAAMQEELTAILEQLHTSGMTIIIATHDLDFAYGWADEVIVMQTGRVVAQGDATEILLRDDVQDKLGAAPLVAEITRRLSLIGIELRDKECPLRNKQDLLEALTSYSLQEKKP